MLNTNNAIRIILFIPLLSCFLSCNPSGDEKSAASETETVADTTFDKQKWAHKEGADYPYRDQMVNDAALTEVIDAVGYHYVCEHLPLMDHEDYAATDNAKNCGVPLWASEDWSMYDGSWKNAHILTGIFNKFYINSAAFLCCSKDY